MSRTGLRARAAATADRLSPRATAAYRRARPRVVATYRRLRPRAVAWIRRFGPTIAAAVIAIAAVVGLMERPSTVSTTHRAGYVVITGSAGLRWDDVNPTDTPTLWALAGKDAIAALSVRSGHSPTCPSDGWLTLGAGNFARATATLAAGKCPPATARLQTSDNRGALLPDWPAKVSPDNRSGLGAQPGALAEAVRCTVAVGRGAAIAAARPYGRVDRYSATLPADPTALLGGCTLSIVDLGTVGSADPVARASQARAVDAKLATVLAHRPPDSLVLVAGLSDTDATSRLHVAIADGPGYAGGWLTSTSTGRSGYLQVVDLAPTALAALGNPLPTKLFAGAQAERVGGRPADPARAIGELSDADHRASVRQGLSGWFFGAYTIAETVLLIAAIPLLRRARRSAEPSGAKPVSPRIVRAVELLLVAAAMTIPVAVLTDVVPWWRPGLPGLWFALVGAAFSALAAVTVMYGPWRRGALGPVGAAATVATSIIGIDVLTGSNLQLNGVVGYSAAAGIRYAGIGPAALGAFVVGILLVAAGVAQVFGPRRWRPAIVGGIVGVGVIVVGSPFLGADPGGALALTAGGCVAAAISSGGWLTFTRLAWATLTGLAVLIGFAVLDLGRPVAERSSLGRFITQFHDGTAGTSVHRTGVEDVVATASSAVSLMVIVAVAYNVLVLFRPWGGLMRLFGLYPAVRGAMTGMGIAAVLAGLLDGAGFITAGGAAAVALPLVTLAALRVLDHADDRTVGAQVAEGAPDPAAPPQPGAPPVAGPPAGAEPAGAEPAGAEPEPVPANEPAG